MTVEEVEDYMQGRGNSFEAALVLLIAKADSVNLKALASIYPYAVEAVEKWRKKPKTLIEVFAAEEADGKTFKLSADCPPCETCGEPWCPDCEEHYAECKCPGPHSYMDEKDK